ncbi:hypothetical protein Bca52824_059939 [Brassica carinata]|uniref:Uncharacterized protein n=1 Tax=Brassica carinata TaxID=52824 RepID=A0A8X7QV38_BRACI|nr:hypothetical protein Bca52824_059939 [Brassica carinata]
MTCLKKIKNFGFAIYVYVVNFNIIKNFYNCNFLKNLYLFCSKSSLGNRGLRTSENCFPPQQLQDYTKRINEWKQKFDVGEVPKHINPDAYGICVLIGSKDDTKSLSTINSQNRCSVAGKGMFVHNLGQQVYRPEHFS